MFEVLGLPSESVKSRWCVKIIFMPTQTINLSHHAMVPCHHSVGQPFPQWVTLLYEGWAVSDSPLLTAALLNCLFYLKLEASVSETTLLGISHKEYPLPNQTSSLFHHQPMFLWLVTLLWNPKGENRALFDPAHGQKGLGDVSYDRLVQGQWNQLKILQGLKQV